jgi:3-oxoacyl-[acyl-carrier protein] reductase
MFTEKKSLNCLVTGGLGGIGNAIAHKLLQRGDRVFVFDCVPPTDERVQQLQEKKINYFQVDLASVDAIKQGFIQLDQQASGRLDLLVNNAGITRDALALRLSEADWDAVLSINLKGAFFCAQQALLRMIKQPCNDSIRGFIVNISSVVGRTGNPGQVNYAASKAALNALTKTLAQEYASRQILVNAIAPGFIQTSMTEKLSESVKQFALDHIPLKRFGMSDDIADAVLFFASSAASYITGQILEVTGGMSL